MYDYIIIDWNRL